VKRPHRPSRMPPQVATSGVQENVEGARQGPVRGTVKGRDNCREGSTTAPPGPSRGVARLGARLQQGWCWRVPVVP
jgi:hypothetical protein